MTDLVPSDLDETVTRALAEIKAGQIASESRTAAIGFFDLVGSTRLKLDRGHEIGEAKAREFIALTHAVTNLCGGELIKTLGDGVMVLFPDPLGACRAAVSAKRAWSDSGIRGSAGVAFGVLGVSGSGTTRDVIGTTVDRAARLEGLAMPGQILIDSALMESARSYLRSYSDVIVSQPLEVNAKGLSDIQVFELSLRPLGLAERVVTPFEIYPNGRMALQDKTRFARQARVRIQEFGTGLTSFARYFTGNRPDEFKDHIRDILRRGVDLECYGLAPTSRWVNFVKQTSGSDYVEEAARARAAILQERNRFIAAGLPGELRYFEYDHVPEFHGFAIDPDDEIHAQVLISFYMPGMARAEAPVYQVARAARPELYAKYAIAMKALEDTSLQVDR